MTTAIDGPVVITTSPWPCVDLRATFPGRFTFEGDEAYDRTLRAARPIGAPWLTTIPGRYGKIFPFGGRQLAAMPQVHARSTRAALVALDGVRVRYVGPELLVIFDVSQIETVAAILESLTASC